MKILLVKPPSLSDHIQPPLGLGYLAASVAGRHPTIILDLMKTPLSAGGFRRFVSEGKFDLVGFQCYTPELPSVAALSRLVKEVSPHIATVVGGPHPTLLPKETMEYFGDAVDWLLRGEGEESFPRFTEALSEGRLNPASIPGLVWKKGGTIHVNEKAAAVFDLDRVPYPSWELIRPETYPPAQHGAFFKRFPIAPIITTRGCPFDCKFCSANALSGRAMRFRNPQSVVEEIRMLYGTYGIREFHIIDDNFTINKAHARAVLEGIVAAHLPISLAFPNGIRIETVDASLLSLMKKSGVYLISLGLESGSNRVLALMNKKLTVEKNEEKIRLIRKAKIDMAAFFMMGYPGETEADIRRTIAYSLRLPLLRANFENFLPLPGSPVYDELKRKGELNGIEWRNYHYMTATYIPHGLTKKTLRRLQRQAFLRFFLRPRILLRHIVLVKTLRHFMYLAKRVYHWLIMQD